MCISTYTWIVVRCIQTRSFFTSVVYGKKSEVICMKIKSL